jgi:hypothetical protein
MELLFGGGSTDKVNADMLWTFTLPSQPRNIFSFSPLSPRLIFEIITPCSTIERRVNQ